MQFSAKAHKVWQNYQNSNQKPSFFGKTTHTTGGSDEVRLQVKDTKESLSTKVLEDGLIDEESGIFYLSECKLTTE